MGLDLQLLFQIAVIGIAAAILGTLLKQSGRDEIATMVTITSLILVTAVVVTHISSLFSQIRAVFFTQ
ncbi:stage III sporulation protein AC [Ferroacidibacillus organovorans]|uniref:Stage III sporulation protein AC n=1 Tax=Ferroacidibacillus organovorans TaxID=1765683 RepID=A0A101XSK6_9BACL|nr:stage III sporulation protein AC [Ferroacidibacillus organovorans]KUO96775.1 stage III sporulation protein AC [Ferroacidibacillus organovorans]